jgi:hypothetical protein
MSEQAGLVATIAAGVVLALLLLWAIWWAWWRLPKRQVRKLDIQIHDPKARADAEDNFRKTIGQALGGLAVLIAAAFGLFQFLQQQRTASEQQRTAADQFAQQQQASHDLLISNQVSKGFEQLGSGKIAVRLGGIYALEGVMNTSKQYHQPVLEALCAFVREGTRRGKKSEDSEPGPDFQAALTVIGRRARGEGAVNLLYAMMPFADLNNADLSNAKMFGTDLSRGKLTGANLTGVYLRRSQLINANLTGANLTRADLLSTDLTGAKLIDANLTGADLTGAYLSGADLTGAKLSDADLTDATGLTRTQLDQACGKPKALPPGLTLDKPCPPR